MPTLGDLHKLEMLIRTEYDDDLRVSTINGVKFRLFSSTKSKAREFESYNALLNFLHDQFTVEHDERMRLLAEFREPSQTALDRHYAVRASELFGNHEAVNQDDADGF